MRQTLIAGLKRFTRDPSTPVFRFSLEKSQLFPWISDVTFVAYPKSGLRTLMRAILLAAEHHATATTNVVSSYGQLRRQFPFLPVLRTTRAGSTWRHRVLDASDLRSYSPGEWVSGGKVVFIQRDPREVLAATFEDLRTSFYLRDVEPADLIDNEIVGARKLGRFINRWQGWCAGNPNCLVVSFDAFEDDPAAELRKLSEFCGFGFSTSTIAVACKAIASKNDAAGHADGPPRNAGNGHATGSDVWAVGHHQQPLSYRDVFSEGERKHIEEIFVEEIDPEPRHAR